MRNRQQGCLLREKCKEINQTAIMIRNLRTIQPIVKEDILLTGSRPFWVMCDDYKTYLCKYNRGEPGRPTVLMKELLAASFLPHWELKGPEFVFIEVDKAHAANIGLHPYYFDLTCFGTQYNNKYKEVDKFFADYSGKQRKKIVNVEDFLFIALFDLWMANEDRTTNNPNLLFDTENYSFIPIDHEAVFNTRTPADEITQLNFEDSILYSNLLHSFFTKNELSDNEFIDKMRQKYYLCIENCRNSVPAILGNLPDNWNYDKENLHRQLLESIFRTNWVDTSFTTFVQFLQLANNQ
jgi:hypothetical protein